MKSYLVKVSGAEYGYIQKECARLHCKKSYYLRTLLFKALDHGKAHAGIYICTQEDEVLEGGLRAVQVYIPDHNQSYLQRIRKAAAKSRLPESQVAQCLIGASLKDLLTGGNDEAI